MINKSSASVSYIISAYNEGTIIRDSINYCIECLEKDFTDYEIILINDGSKDNTGEIINELAAKNDKIKVLHNLINLNLGISMQRGFMSASKDYIFYNAVDLPLNPNTTKELVDEMEGVDVLVLQRVEYLGTNLWRRFTSFINRGIVLMLFPNVKRGIRDTNYTQVFRRSIITQIMPIARSPIFTWPEMIFRAKYSDLSVKVHDIEYNPRTVRKGAFGKPNDILWGLYEMLRFRIHQWLRK